jgi:signal transduction histidine kinase
MSLKTKILLVFLAILTVSIGVTSLFHFFSARQTHLQEIFNKLESTAEAKKLRMQGIISKRKEQIVLLQIREQLRENFHQFLQIKDPATQEDLTASLVAVRDNIDSFKELHLVSMQGRVEASSSARYVGADFSRRESFQHALAGELCVHEFFYDQENALNIHLSGLLTVNGQHIGVMVVQAGAGDILSIINDYTGLGETGETTLARRVNGKVFYLTPTRFFPEPGDTLVRPDDPQRAMSLALAGEEKLQPGVIDYRGEQVVASPRFLPEVRWGLTTKIDRKEVMAPIWEALLRTLLLALVMVAAVAIVAHYFSRNLVRPIVSLGESSKDIANGNLDKRIAYKGRNEVGQLAENFNLMADKLVETNQVLERKIQELDRNNESLNQFAYVVSHDLKSPLHSIRALTGLLRESLTTCDDPDIQKVLILMEDRARHMEKLITGILKYSMSGITREEQEVVNLEELIKEVVQYLQVPSHIHITLEPLPIVLIERILILQVFQNLIGNAIKYMDKPQGWVTVESRKEEGFILFLVRDNGRGIEKRNLEKVFDLFNKTHDLPGIDSSGLGLSIVKKIVESKGGRAWVESVAGLGSAFYFTLPENTVLEDLKKLV